MKISLLFCNFLYIAVQCIFRISGEAGDVDKKAFIAVKNDRIDVHGIHQFTRFMLEDLDVTVYRKSRKGRGKALDGSIQHLHVTDDIEDLLFCPKPGSRPMDVLPQFQCHVEEPGIAQDDETEEPYPHPFPNNCSMCWKSHSEGEQCALSPDLFASETMEELKRNYWILQMLINPAGCPLTGNMRTRIRNARHHGHFQAVVKLNGDYELQKKVTKREGNSLLKTCFLPAPYLPEQLYDSMKSIHDSAGGHHPGINASRVSPD